MDPIRIALPKGRNLKPSVALFRAIGLDFTEALGDSRKLIFDAPGAPASAIIVRDADVPTYVENGAADFGVSGADQLAEQRRDLYEPVDLGFGYCRLVVAEPKELSLRDNPKEWVHLKVATKFVGITERHFARRGVQIEIIKLYGSIELAPLVGLSDRIVDLVSTGATLKQNGLVEVEQIMEATARLVVNRASLRTKRATVARIIEQVTAALPTLDLPKYA
ncbi:MAG: ATP phosphoribosyltransferase [Nitrospinae bacterium]|nr:ATP phosphoribosyltransferase [Nitrospinota bacterium]